MGLLKKFQIGSLVIAGVSLWTPLFEHKWMMLIATGIIVLNIIAEVIAEFFD